ncbi:MAG: Gfo/Idh/MocA family oxidoreductase [Verrucomicrobiota bacterium]
MTSNITRRTFLRQSSLLTAGLAALSTSHAIRAASSPNTKLRVAVIGCNARGMAHIAGLLAVPNVEIVTICDVDSRAVAKGVAAVLKKQGTKPKGVADLRRVLDDREVDAVTIATPDHWHAPAAIMACAAGKHVYVEKPGSHNAHESGMIVAAARRHTRLVQMGNQRRSWPWVIESIESLKAGVIGKVSFARGWYTNNRASIGRGKPVPVPEWLNYDLWQGPAPERPYRDNVIHYNWHWFWNWATGEFGNNGVHALDLARWGMGVNLPNRVTCGGNRYFYQDDWETPDTIVAMFDFGDKGIAWEGQSCAPRGFEGASFGVTFYGEKGCMSLAGNDCKIYDLNNKEIRAIDGKQKDLFSFDAIHFNNFADAIRDGKPLAAEIAEGQKSSLMCHLGNIAWRTGQTVNCDPATGKILKNKAANAFWKREYRHGWEPKI